MNTEDKFKQLLMKIEPHRWQYKGPRVFTVEAGDAVIKVEGDCRDLKYYAAIFKAGEEICRTTIYTRREFYSYLRACEDAAMANNAKKIDQVMDDFASIIFGVGDTKAASSISFDIEQCAPAEV